MLFSLPFLVTLASADDGLHLLQMQAHTRLATHAEDFVCDLCAESDNEFDPTGKKGKCEKINARAQKNAARCEKRKGRKGVIRGCCPAPPVECDLCPAGLTFNPDNLDGKCAKIATRSTKNEEKCNQLKNKKRVQKKCCDEEEEAKTYTPEDFELTKSNECPEGSKSVDYKTCHDQAGNYQWPGQKAGHTQRWDEEDHDPEFGAGWTFMPPGCVLYIGWRGDSHEAQVRWNPNQNGKNDGHRALVCEKATDEEEAKPEEEQKVGYIETKGVSCGWLGACGGDKNQAYINNGARQLSASASDVSSCEELCDKHDECDGFCLVGSVCYFRKDTECNDMPPTAGRSCWQKPIQGRQCSTGQFRGGEACETPAAEEPAKPTLGQGQHGKCISPNGPAGGTQCGRPDAGEIAYSSDCSRFVLCEDKPGCIAKGITSPETCMATVAKEDNCEKDFFEWRVSLGSHCFCNPKGRKWVPYNGFPLCVTYPMK
jgi:hypothetical protein